ncbi:beta-defensin 114 [Sciurus carolinensis]|uniref:beta-defensin 114 n=1 Tax=Sciurus carolinensis TaxID=30640 RepID=UPI001FB2D152|nr:beta-defensin 114 [Sciurus carolinensis]
MKIISYLLHFLCYMTFILQATCSMVDDKRCTQHYGHCRRNCYITEKKVDLCFSIHKICCIMTFAED